MGLHRKLLQITLPGVVIIAIAVVVAAQAKQNCAEKCGNLNIPYPFGMVEDCYLEKNFMVTCEGGTPKVGSVLVQSISFKTHELIALQTGAQDCPDQPGQHVGKSDYSLPEAPPFTISGRKNRFTVVGCDTSGSLRGFKHGQSYLFGCTSGCPSNPSNVVNGPCSSGCCQVEIPDGLTNVSVEVKSSSNHAEISDFNPCGYAFPVKKDEFNFSSHYLTDLPNKMVPVVFQWAVGNETCEKAQKNGGLACHPSTTDCENGTGGLGYRCFCKHGYDGNPYLPEGCKDINECGDSKLNNCTAIQKCQNTNGSYSCLCPKWLRPKGKKPGRSCVPSPGLTATISIGTSVSFAVTLSVSFRLCLVHKKRSKEKCFAQNGGLILEREQQDQPGSNEKAEIFSLEELKKATKNFHESSIIGRGGFGTSYKGTLTDKRTVAIKKSWTVNESQKEQFINEVVVLSRINHGNIVKLLGCCLETKVPLLVYEFVSNHTLSEYIHRGNKLSAIRWETRIKIAVEVAEVLSYLHSATLKPIIHRDVKSANILLIDDVTPKVFDFGISKLVPQDQGKLVQGTPGYLDPEYLQTNQLTEKSDVYSFGVVLVELLTGEEAFSLDRSEKERSLAMYFLSYLKQDRIFEVIDNDIVEEGNKEHIKEVVELANRCLRVNGDERPTMEEVAVELERIRKTNADPLDDPQSDEQESKQLPGETFETYEDDGSGGGAAE